MEEEKKQKIRSHSWGAANISWSVVVEELLYAAEQMGHDVTFLSTNGHRGMKYWDQDKGLEQEFQQRQFIREKGEFDIDLTYTVPQNFPQRFLKGSKCKMAIYAYESSIMPEQWKKFYRLVDYMLPPSQYCADMMIRNGCPKEKIKVIPHGVDPDVFNIDVPPVDLKNDKSVKFLCVAEPHYRKQLDRLLEVYCKRFTAKDDVCLVLKTKIFKTKKEYQEKRPFEMDLKPTILKLKKKYGKNMPDLKIVSKRLKNIAGLYTACDAFALMTASEGWGVPYLEALAVGIPVIAPRQGGQLQFLNDDNAILTPCGVRRARAQEQYWGGHPKATVGNPDEKAFGDAMHQMYKDIWAMKNLKDRSMGATTQAAGIGAQSTRELKAKYETMREHALATAKELTWKGAMQQILDIAEEHGK